MDNRLDTWISKVIPGGNSKQEAPRAPQGQPSNPTAKPHFREKSKNFSHRKKHFPHKNPAHQPQIQPRTKGASGPHLRAIALGGLNEVGRNCMCLEYGNDIIIVDAGLQFPEDGMYGVNYVIPDTRYIEQKKQNIRAILITHAHLDHIGGLAYLLPKLNFPPVYASPLATGLIERQLKEHSGMEKVRIHRLNSEKDILRFGAFTVEYFHVNHSIPDASGLYIETPTAKIVHTGDFKFDFSPADGIPADFSKIAKIGARGVDAIFADSTNAQKEGFCVSEKVVADTLEKIIRTTKNGRLFIASFSSVLARWQQIIKFAQKYNRKIYVTGRSLLENLRIASDMGYIRVPHGLIHKVTKKMHDTPPHEQLIITTGAQGEENAALARIVRGEHDTISVEKGDTVVLAASAIIGNERQVTNLVNELYKLGVHVITKSKLDVHTSGHAFQGDLKLMYGLIKPKNIIPVHGEYHMRYDHAKMVQEDLGYAEENTALLNNGEVLEIAHGKIYKTHEQVPGDHIFVDGKMVGDVGVELQQERKMLMNGGVVTFTFAIDQVKKTLRRPVLLQSLGFMYPIEQKALEVKLTQEGGRILERLMSHIHDPQHKKEFFQKELCEKLMAFILELTGREPQVIIELLFE